ncbi:hypothetical protein MKEN_00501400 [Mycena kentingensis (nom. inval.)]|nr:hypothetical protein MKEN_00501400 [Mycena kentingensis (nom. inval.)]
MNAMQRPSAWQNDPAFLLIVVPATLISSAIVLAFTMPFIGTLIRFRANYTPRSRVQLDAEEGEESPTEDVKSYFAMLKRVHRVEGWPGLYKGVMPSILESLISVVFVTPMLAVLYVVSPARHFHTLITLLFAVCSVLLLIPMEIIKNRTITTPYKLRAFEPSKALRLLLTRAERKAPLRLYLLPGVALASALPVIISLLITMVWQIVAFELLPLYGTSYWSLAHAVHRLCGVAFLILTTALITPLHVIRVRLTMQTLPVDPAAAPSPAGEEPQPEHAPEAQVYSSEDVVELRSATGRATYTGVEDCGRSILREEGKAAFFRGWWLTALGLAPMFLFRDGLVYHGFWFAR